MTLRRFECVFPLACRWHAMCHPFDRRGASIHCVQQQEDILQAGFICFRIMLSALLS